jgi:putative salt-induced outer membrane protein
MRMWAAIAFAAGVAASATGQVAPVPLKATNAWTGEGSFSASISQGDTNSTDLAAGLRLKHTHGRWSESLRLDGEYDKDDHHETENRIYGSFQMDYRFDPKWSALLFTSAENDKYSGFGWRYFFGVGAGYDVVHSKQVDWVLQGGPGYKIDHVRAYPATPPLTEVIPETVEESIGLAVASRFKYRIAPKIELSNDTAMIYVPLSTEIENITALTADLWGNLKVRFSYEIRHDTDPPPQTKQTNASTKLSLVYKVD